MTYNEFREWYRRRPKHLLTFNDTFKLWKAIYYVERNSGILGNDIWWREYNVHHNITGGIVFPINELLTVSMSYDEFVQWCNMCACDGLWNKCGAMLCIKAMNHVNQISKSKKKREIEWRRYELEHHLIDNVVNPTNERFIKMMERLLHNRGFKTLNEETDNN